MRLSFNNRSLLPRCSRGMIFPGLVLLFLVATSLESLSADRKKESAATAGADADSQVILFPDDRWLKRADIARKLQELENESWRALDEENFASALDFQVRRAKFARASYGAKDVRAKRAALWESTFQRMLELPETGKEAVLQARTADREGQKFTARDKHEFAKARFEQATRLYESVLGRDDGATLWCSTRLASSEALLGDYATSKQRYLEGLSIYKRHFGTDDVVVALFLHNVALNEYHLKSFDAAEEHWQQALSIMQLSMREHWTEDDAANLARMHSFLAAMKNDLSRFDEAERHAHEAAHSAAARSVVDGPLFIQSQIELGRSLNGRGKGDEAGIAFARAVSTMQILKLKFPKDPPPAEITVQLLTQYAEHLRRVGRIADATRCETLLKELSGSKKPEGTDNKPIVDRSDIGTKYLK